ncbi:NAD-dependent protein deacylase [Fundicoccus sp. Sow4_H7]|uniref:NAD-dependent protein deacylase n=1 Tax=Fundicoccus sp. Sow4_H7 TaxID=3438784 RepID=UPI003F8F8F3F
MDTRIRQMAEIIHIGQNIVFFGGAGVSTESGIPDFRSANGILHEETGTHYSAEQVISAFFFKKFPAIFFDFHFEHLVYPDAQPNTAHKFLADLESSGKNIKIITQNIDRLHQKAGSQHVVELHGAVDDNYCIDCLAKYSYDQLQIDEDGIPRCQLCHGIVRPNIVLYEEVLDEQAINQAVQDISNADVLIIGGTSLKVYPAASFIHYFKGKHLLVINKTTLTIAQPNILTINGNIAEVFENIQSVYNEMQA